MRRTALALTLLMLGLGQAPAQDAGQLGLAREMLVRMRAADNFDAVMPSIMQALRPVITGGNAKTAKDWDEIAPLIAREFSAMKSGLLNDIAGIYARSFDKAELEQLVTFYKTPVGEKLARLTPALAQETMAAGQKFGQEVAGRLAERMKDELRKRGNKV